KIVVSVYDGDGNLLVEGLKQGASGSLVKLREFTYEPRTVNGVTIYLKVTSTVYRDATDTEASNPVATNFAYTWYKKGVKDTFQVKTITTTLPAVPNSENGDNQTGTLVSTYDRYGFLIKQEDALGTKTKYAYELRTGGLIQQIEDAGWARMNLTTDYQLDPLGRTVRTLGPVHEISIEGVATNIRRA